MQKIAAIFVTPLPLVFLLSSPAVASSQKTCLQEALYFEARSEGWRGMLAVGVVIKNRVRHPKYPETVCAVVRQGQYMNGNPIRDKCQFSFWCDGKPEKIDDENAWVAAGETSRLLMSTYIIIEGMERVTHYHANYVSPKWSKYHIRIIEIGKHIFYEEPSAN